MPVLGLWCKHCGDVGTRQIPITAVTAESRITCSQYLVTSPSSARATSTAKPTAKPPPPPSNCPDSTRCQFFMRRVRWRPCCSLVRSDRPRHDDLCAERANPGFTKVITVLVRRRSKFTGNTVLFVGTSDAGKTTILSSVSLQLTNRPV